MSIIDRIEIEAPAAAVWALTVDVARWPELLPATVQAVEVDPGWLRLGGTARIKQPAQPWRTWTVTELEAERRLVWETLSFGGRMIARHELAGPAGGPVVNTLAIELTGSLARQRERLLRRPIARAIGIENAAFKAEAEGGAQRASRTPPMHHRAAVGKKLR